MDRLKNVYLVQNDGLKLIIAYSHSQEGSIIYYKLDLSINKCFIYHGYGSIVKVYEFSQGKLIQERFPIKDEKIWAKEDIIRDGDLYPNFKYTEDVHANICKLSKEVATKLDVYKLAVSPALKSVLPPLEPSLESQLHELICIFPYAYGKEGKERKAVRDEIRKLVKKKAPITSDIIALVVAKGDLELIAYLLENYVNLHISKEERNILFAVFENNSDRWLNIFKLLHIKGLNLNDRTDYTEGNILDHVMYLDKHTLDWEERKPIVKELILWLDNIGIKPKHN